MKVTSAKISAFRDMIFSWWQEHKRDLPWRHTRDPYRILVSEVMLQQTQVARVLLKYEEFLRAFPDVYALSTATTAHVLRLWRGMGYNRRALYLKKTAEAIVGSYGGKFPQSEQELRKLPGLGVYTTRALLVFAFNQHVAMVDTNIRKIITHFFFHDRKQSDKVIQKVADTLVPHGKSWEWHQALMDYGALEMPKYRAKHQRGTRASVPFHGSNRFYRGRIIDVLREGRENEAQLIHRLVAHYGKSDDFFMVILSGLVKDGLIVRRGADVMLPV